MRKVTCLVFVLFVFIACNDNKKKGEEATVIVKEFVLGKIAKPKKANAKAKAILEEWPEFNALETSFNALYKVNSEEGLTVVIEDLIEKQKLLKASDYPEKFNLAEIKSRQNVFKSFILKVKGDIEYRVAPQESIKQMVKAYNAYKNQFNVVVSNPLNLEALILDEK